VDAGDAAVEVVRTVVDEVTGRGVELVVDGAEVVGRTVDEDAQPIGYWGVPPKVSRPHDPVPPGRRTGPPGGM
jgi:hypothetical protein